MPGRDILGNDALVAPAALARAVVPSFVFFLGSDRRFVQEMQDQSVKRGSSAKELGEQGATRGAAKKLQQMAAVGVDSGNSQFARPVMQTI
jgi:hypothetical protein